MSGRKKKSLADVRAIRDVLGKSQAQMAELLGVSIRAVQSYEQGWRPTPPTVQRLAVMLLFVARGGARGGAAPCWKVNDCPPAIRSDCFAYQSRCGQACWGLSGTRCGGKKFGTWEEKMETCRECAVMKRWLGD